MFVTKFHEKLAKYAIYVEFHLKTVSFWGLLVSF
jgi:hypothetical protein